MKKLWDQGYDVNKEVEKFTVGNDYIIDQKLVKYDLFASIAHAKMLHEIGVLSKKELNVAVKGLKKLLVDGVKITVEDEDCHTAIEKALGSIGKKIHTARSRNDQVLTAMRLYEKEELKQIVELISSLEKSLSEKIKLFGKIEIPGYTHMQKAMSTTIKDWLGCFSSACKDDKIIVADALKLIDKSPLGSAAGFGVPMFKVDKKMTAKEMGFSKIIDNPIYCQMSRGKFEAAIIHALSQVMFTLNKLSSDLMLFNMSEFGFVSLPKEFCTGSSIMPQKKNPDVLELVRAKYSVVLGEQFKVQNLIANLLSGYNRDLQLVKEPLFNSVDTTKDCLEIMTLVISNLKVNKDACKKAMTKELFATEGAYKLVKKGVPFREAYKLVSKKFH
ncbi:MAG: argininosuccinate lyase [Nanoarchaeota archaeon]